MRKEGHVLSHSWWRVCKSMWRANEQESRARLGLWKEGRETFKILNLRMAFCLPLTEQINTISNASGMYVPKPTNFALSYLFQNIPSLLPRSLLAIQSLLWKTLSWESKSGRQWPRIRAFISITINNLLLTYLWSSVSHFGFFHKGSLFRAPKHKGWSCKHSNLFSSSHLLSIIMGLLKYLKEAA